MITNFKKFLITENKKFDDFLLKFGFSYDEILDHVKMEFPYEEDARFETDFYLDVLKELYEKGGKLYRLVFLDGIQDLKNEELGEHWTTDTGNFTRFYNTLRDNSLGENDYLITAHIDPGEVDAELSIRAFKSLPTENEINLKNSPKNYQIEKYGR